MDWTFSGGKLEPATIKQPHINFQESLEEWGFCPYPVATYANREGRLNSMLVHVPYPGSHPSIPFQFIIGHGLYLEWYTVYIPTYPDFLQFFALISPLLQTKFHHEKNWSQ